MELAKLKELISQNEEVMESLQECSDDLLLENIPLILSALFPDGINEGHKIWITHNKTENTLDWKYVPITADTKRQHQKTHIERHYSLKLDDDFNKYYLLELNKLDWTIGRDSLKTEFFRIVNETKDDQVVVKGIWIVGEHGSGNTIASIAFLNYFANLGKSVAYISIPELISLTQNSFNINSWEKRDETYVETIRKADFLVLDNIGVERPTPWFKENILLPLLDYRMKSNKTTVFVSTNTIKKYHDKLNGRSQNKDLEEDTNNSIINKINLMVSSEVKVSGNFAGKEINI